MQNLTAEEYRILAEKHREAMKNEMIIFLKTGIITIAAVIALIVGSIAWFANNSEVRANNAMVTVGTPSASLFIALGDTIDKNYYSSVSLGTTKSLYPISTVDCANWYYVSSWKSVLANPDVPTDKTTTPVACGYSKAENISFDANDSAAKYTVDERTFYAFYKQTVNVYTDRDSLDVYLSPDQPISLSYSSDSFTAAQKARADRIRSGLRVAVTVADASGNEQLMLYYVPVDENGKGNSAGAKANAYHGIYGVNENDIAELSDYYNSTTIGAITAELNADSKNEYLKKSGSVLLGNADSEKGLVLNAYVWLEGTDAQTLKDITAGINDGLSVVLSVVGVEPDSTKK